MASSRNGLLLALATSVSLGLLPACSTLAPVSPAPAQTGPAALPRPAWHEFEIEGRVAVTHLEERYFGRFAWRHWRSPAAGSTGSTGSDELLISTPLGQTVAELGRDALGARLRLSSGEVHQAADADRLLADVLKLPLPVSQLSDWLLGRSGGVTGARLSLDEQQRPQRQQVAGWQIDYLYADDGGADALPRRVSLSRPGEADGPEITLRIDSWQTP